MVHKGTIVQTVVSSWTISAGGSKSHTITADDLGGYSNSDKFYFRFNSSPIGNRYSISGFWLMFCKSPSMQLIEGLLHF